MRDIVVGIDGSVASSNALDRALRMGQLTDRMVTVVHAWCAPTAGVGGFGSGYLYDPVSSRHDARLAALRLLDSELALGLARLGSDRPAHVRAVEVESPVGLALARMAHDAACLLVGGRARGRITGALGVTVPHVLHHASCPIVVIPENAPPVRSFHRVVVGIDGSESSRSALRWAYDLAQRDGCDLVAVHAQGHARPTGQSSDEGWFEEVEAVVHDAKEHGTSLRVIRHRSAGDALLAEAGGGDLLVVGSRGNGMLAGLVLGSVSAHVVARSLVPVAVVRAHEERLEDLATGATRVWADVT